MLLSPPSLCILGPDTADIYRRGFPMALFALMAMFFTGLGPVMMSWVEIRPDLGWRWIQWIEMSMSDFLITSSAHRYCR